MMTRGVLLGWVGGVTTDRRLKVCVLVSRYVGIRVRFFVLTVVVSIRVVRFVRCVCGAVDVRWFVRNLCY